MGNSASQKTITAETAMKACQAAVKKAGEMEFAICVAVYDSSAQLKAYLRMEGAPMASAQIAEDKAYTSASFQSTTDSMFEWIKTDEPLLHGLNRYGRMITFGGGYPIKEDGQLIGAIGISGGHYTQDMECCKAALEAIGLAA